MEAVLERSAVKLVAPGVFGVLGWALVRFEGLRRPSALDHLRHCILLYALLGFLGYVLAANYEANLGPSTLPGSLTGGYIAAILGFIVTGYAISIDALVLVWQRRRSIRVSQGDGP